MDMRNLLAILIMASLLLTGCGEDRTEKSTYTREVSVGSPAPLFTYPDMDGEPFRLENERGRVVVLFFWRYRCKECREMFPSLKRLETLYEGKPLTIITIDEDTIHSGSIYTITNFFKENGYTFRVLRDDGAYLAGLYKTLWTPTVVVVDKDGTIAFLSVREKLDFTAPSFRSIIDRLLSDRTPQQKALP